MSKNKYGHLVRETSVIDELSAKVEDMKALGSTDDIRSTSPVMATGYFLVRTKEGYDLRTCTAPLEAVERWTTHREGPHDLLMLSAKLQEALFRRGYGSK